MTGEELLKALGPDGVKALTEAIGQKEFTLDGSAMLPKKVKFKRPLAEYEGTYGVSERTLKRWVSSGRHSRPVDLPPIDEPGKMATWYRRVYPKEHVPEKLLELETQKPAAEPVPEPEKPPVPQMSSVDLESVTLDEGEQVLQARRIMKANYQRVAEASEQADLDGYRKWFPIWQDSANALRQLVRADNDERKLRGDYVKRAEIESELAQLSEALRIMHDNMPRRIMAELEKSADRKLRRVLRLLGPEIRRAVEKVRGAEIAMFRGIDLLSGPAKLSDAA